jgi:hypothetical protein
LEIDELAKYAGSFFVTKTRPTDKPRAEGASFIALKKRRPTWVVEMVKRVHDDGKWFPDDYKYEYTDQALNVLATGMNPEEPELEADVYTSDIYKWFTSHLERSAYVDEATKEWGHSDQGIVSDLMMGQVREKEEVFRLVVDALEERLKDIELGVDESWEGGTKKGPLEWSPRDE